jgi:plasmid stability protein
MAVLNIRNLPDAVHRELRKRAAGHGRSIEAEARAPRRSIAEIQKAIDAMCREPGHEHFTPDSGCGRYRHIGG